MLCKALWATTAFAAGLVAVAPSSSQNDFAACLSDGAEIWYPGSEEFANATLRWGAAQTPQYDMVVKVATEADVQETARKIP